MRFLIAFLFFTAAVVETLLGSGALYAARSVEFEARIEAGDLSSVAGDLASREELQRMQRVGDERAGTAGRSRRLLGAALIGLALVQTLAGILRLRRQARRPVLAAGLVGTGALTALLVLGHPSMALSVAAALTMAATLLCLLPFEKTLPDQPAAATGTDGEP